MGNGRELIERAAEAVERIRALGRADETLLEPVVAAVLGETARNRFRAAGMLAELTAKYAEARTAVASLASDARAHVRRRAMRCLSRGAPREFTAEILRAGLADPDAGVRMKAVSVAGLVERVDLVPSLATAESGSEADETIT